MNVELGCSAGGCVHNVNGLCSANVIHVLGSGAHISGETMCDTFAPRSFENAFAHLPNMNVAGEIKQVFTNKSIEMSPIVKCEAINCIYNEGRKCSASNVQIHGPNADNSEETVCETFRKG